MEFATKKLNIFIGTGEASGDDLAIYFIDLLIQTIQEKNPKLLDQISFYAVAGEKIKAKNIPLLFGIEKLSVMGISEIFFSLPRLIYLRKKIYQFCLKWRADIFIGVDSPDFYLSLENKLKKKGITTIHIGAPSVYAWRSYRLHKIAFAVDYLIGIMPYEEKFISAYCKRNSLKLNYLSLTHPIYLNQISATKEKNLKDILDIKEEKKIIALFLGSRRSEIKRHLPKLIEFIESVKNKYQDYVFVSSVTSLKHHQLINDAIANNQLQSIFFSTFNQLESLINQCEMVISKSGTINLYAARAHKPMIIFYQISALTYFIVKRLLYKKMVSPVNWSLEKIVFPELIQENFNVKNLTLCFENIISNKDQFKSVFQKIDEQFKKNEIHDHTIESIYQLIESKVRNK